MKISVENKARAERALNDAALKCNVVPKGIAVIEDEHGVFYEISDNQREDFMFTLGATYHNMVDFEKAFIKASGIFLSENVPASFMRWKKSKQLEFIEDKCVDSVDRGMTADEIFDIIRDTAKFLIKN